MTEPTTAAPTSGIISFEGNSVTLSVGDYLLTLKIETREPKNSDRIKLARGQTLFDLVLDAARAIVTEGGEGEFTAADLYHIAVDRNPDLTLKRNSWNSHVTSSAPNHPSYRHYTARRRYFRFLGNGTYALNPEYLGRRGAK